MKQKGFTLVELLVVVIIMGILLTIGVINLRNSQLDSRDSERASDTENIARSLETYYAKNIGSYPYTGIMNSEASAVATLGNINKKSIRAPGITTGSSIVMATNTTTTAAGVLPQPTINQYVYQPIATDGTLCTLSTQECRNYNLFYRDERTNTVIVIRSKNR